MEDIIELSPHRWSATISDDQRQSKANDENRMLYWSMNQFRDILIGGTTGYLSSTTYSSTMTGSSGPAGYPSSTQPLTYFAMISDDDGIQPSIRLATILDDQRQGEANHEIRLKDQFQDIYPNSTTYSGSVTGSTGPRGFELLDEDYIRYYGTLCQEAIDDLRRMAERMNSEGHLRECVKVYSRERKSLLDLDFKRLGIEKLSIHQARRLEWEALEKKIIRWTRAAKICVRILFAREKRHCVQIFGGLGTGTEDASFMETVKDTATQLFDFAEAISMSRRSPERFMRILHLHSVLLDLMPDVNNVFQSESMETIRIRAAEILSRFGESVRRILPEFGNVVRHDLSTSPVPGGTIHTLTRYVMDCVSVILDHNKILTDLIVSKPSTNFGDVVIPDVEYAELERRTPLALHLIWIIVSLRFNLEGKSKYYNDQSLAHLFMVNNIAYIVQEMEGSPELRALTGDYYMKKLAEIVRQEAASYQRSTLERLLYCLRDEGLEVRWYFFSGVSKSALRERLKTFNAIFKEVHSTQAKWVVPNLQLREMLRLSIWEKLIPAYESFLGRFTSHIESGKHPKTYIKYSVKDLETAVLNFFTNVDNPPLGF